MSNHRKAYLEITNRCNLRCAFCPGTARPPRVMTEAEFLSLAGRLAPWAEYLYYHLMGEPLSHPLLPAFVEAAGEMGMRSIITTNGTLLSRRGGALLAARPHKVSISLHSFEANEPGMPFSEYVDGCVAFAREAAEAGVIAVLRLWNLDGRAEGALNARNEEILAALHRDFPGEWAPQRSGFRLRSGVYLEWGEKFDWPSLHGPVLGDRGFCWGLRDQIGVLSDGTVVPCCLDREGDLALGNLHEQSLEEILSSPRARRIYDGFTARRCTEELCRRCMRAAE